MEDFDGRGIAGFDFFHQQKLGRLSHATIFIMKDVHRRQGLLDSVCADIDRVVEDFDGRGIAGFDFFHQQIELGFDLEFCLCDFVCLDIMANDIFIAFFSGDPIVMEILNPPIESIIISKADDAVKLLEQLAQV